jgi:hypothetical protein
LAPAAFALLLGIALSFATPGLLFGIAVAARAALLSVVAFERDAAMLFGRELGVSAAALCIPTQPKAARTASREIIFMACDLLGLKSSAHRAIQQL